MTAADERGLDPRQQPVGVPSQSTAPPSAPTSSAGLPPIDPAHMPIDVWFAGRDLVGEISAKLADAVRAAATGRIVGARVVVTGLRGERDAARAAISPGKLELADDVHSALGVDAQSHVMIGDGALQLWLSRFDAVPAGSTVSLHAMTADGELREVRAAVPPGPDRRLHVAMPWPVDHAPPGEMALVIARDVGGGVA